MSKDRQKGDNFGSAKTVSDDWNYRRVQSSKRKANAEEA